MPRHTAKPRAAAAQAPAAAPAVHPVATGVVALALSALVARPRPAAWGRFGVVLGGILQTERRDSEKKVPGLGDVPVLGHLFKSQSKVNNKGELLIFVTPRILREGAKPPKIMKIK